MKRTHATFSESAYEILDFARCQRADASLWYEIVFGSKLKGGKG